MSLVSRGVPAHGDVGGRGSRPCDARADRRRPLEAGAQRARAAVRANPNDAEASALLARVRLAFGDPDAALPLDPKNIEARRRLISFYTQAPGIAGGDTKKAAALVEEIAKIDTASGHLARAQFLNETKAAGDFESLYRQAIDAAQTPAVRTEALFALLNYFLSPKSQKYDAVEPQARALLQIDPHRAGPYSGLVIAYANIGRVADLDPALAEAEKAAPDNLAPYFQAAVSRRP